MRQSPFGELIGGQIYPQLRCFAACSGFLMEGPAPRNPQLILNLLVVRGCVATARRHSLLSLYRKLMCYLTAKQEFISESRLGRALTKTFLHIPFVSTPFGFMISFGEWALRERCSRHPSSKRYHEWCQSITVPTKEKHKKHKVTKG